MSTRKLEPHERIIFPIDTDNLAIALNLLESVGPHVGIIKIGLQAIMTNHRDASLGHILRLKIQPRPLRKKIMWDVKLSDIPNTVAGAVHSIAQTKVWGFTIHANAGIKSVVAAVENKGSSLVIGVTVLTSVHEKECNAMYGHTTKDQVAYFVDILHGHGADGIVCSPLELESLGNAGYLEDMLAITPGVRPIWASKNDQARIMTPTDAINAGADYIVIGRPISNPPGKIGSPADAAQNIAEEIATAEANLQMI
jgi:orotidine-5'-phosphate decarboxylase